MTEEELRRAQRENWAAAAAREESRKHPQAWWIDRTGEQA